MQRSLSSHTIVLIVMALGISLPLEASSHREAPFVTEHPKVDGTDFYFIRSYESGREGFVTILANYLPLQDAYGGPNYFDLDPAASYRIHVENDGDGVEDINFLFSVVPTLKGLAVPVDGTPVPVSGSQSSLGVVGGDAAGFSNGRRPGDDVVDIELRVAMGLLCHAGLGLCDPGDAPCGTLPFTDGALVEESQFDVTFPYLTDPIPGSPNSVNGVGD